MDFFIGIELTRHCNLSCGHCFRADLTEFAEIPYDTVADILDQAMAYGRPHIALTGGETTLHTRFKDILQLIIKRGYSFHYVTNGYNYQRVFRNLYPLLHHPLWTGVSVSLDGATATTHDAIRGPGSFDKVLGTIAVAKTFKKEVVAQMIVHRQNRSDLTSISLLCSQMGVDRLHIAHMQPTPESVSAGWLQTPDEQRQTERQIRDLQSHFKMPIVISAGFYDPTPIAHCRFLKLGALNINYKGELTACCQLSNLRGSQDQHDIIADLSTTSLAKGHQQLLATYMKVFQYRLENITNNPGHELNHFHCWGCMKLFKKVDWMQTFSDNPWVQQDLYFKTLSVNTKIDDLPQGSVVPLQIKGKRHLRVK